MGQQTVKFESGHRASGNAQWGAFGWLLVITIACSLATFSFGPLAPFLRSTFGITLAEIGFFTTIVNSATSIFSLAAGWVVDRLGIRRCLLIGTAIVGVFFVALAQSHRIEIAYFFTLVIGVGYAFLSPAIVKDLMLSFSPKSRATLVGVRQSGVIIGAAICGATLPPLALALGWQGAVILIGAIIVVVAALNVPLLREPLGIETTQVQPTAVTQIWQVIRSRNVVLLGLVSSGYIATQFSLLTYLILYLTETRTFTVQEAGLVLAAVNVSGACARVIWGFLSDKLFRGRRKPVIFIIGLISLAATTTIGFFGAAMSIPLLCSIFVIFGFSGVGWNGLVLTFAAELGPADMPATSVGSVITFSTIGVLFTSVFGYIVDFTSSYSLAWLFLGFWCAIALVSVTLIREKRPSLPLEEAGAWSRQTGS